MFFSSSLSRGQQFEQGGPDVPLLEHFQQLLYITKIHYRKTFGSIFNYHWQTNIFTSTSSMELEAKSKI